MMLISYKAFKNNLNFKRNVEYQLQPPRISDTLFLDLISRYLFLVNNNVENLQIHFYIFLLKSNKIKEAIVLLKIKNVAFFLFCKSLYKLESGLAKLDNGYTNAKKEKEYDCKSKKPNSYFGCCFYRTR